MIRAILNLREPPLSRVLLAGIVAYVAVLWALGVFQ